MSETFSPPPHPTYPPSLRCDCASGGRRLISCGGRPKPSASNCISSGRPTGSFRCSPKAAVTFTRTLTMRLPPPGTRYLFRIDGGDSRPDPFSRWQPDGVPSAVRRGQCPISLGRIGIGMVCRYGNTSLTELHVGTFTPEGTLCGDRSVFRRTRRPGHHGNWSTADRAIPRQSELGLRRRAPVGGTEHVRRFGRLAAVGRCRSCAGHRGRAGCRLQPHRSGRQLPRPVRALLHEQVSHTLGRGSQLR